MMCRLACFTFLLALLLGRADAQSGGWLAFSRYQGNGVRVGVVRVDGSSARLFDGANCYDASLSPGARQIAYVRVQGRDASTVEVRSLAGGRARIVSRVKGVAFNPVWSPDGKRLAWYALDDPHGKRGPRLFVSNVDGSGLKSVGKGDECFPQWSPDGKRLLYALFDEPAHRNGVGILDLQNGEEKIIYRSDTAILGVAWAPDGQHVVYLQADAGKQGSSLFRLAVDGGEPQKLTDTLEPRLGAQFSQDGKSLYVTRLPGDKKKGGLYVFRKSAGNWIEKPVLLNQPGMTNTTAGAALLLVWSSPAMIGPGAHGPRESPTK